MKKFFSLCAVVAVMAVFASCSKSATTTENDSCSDSIECVSDSCVDADSVTVECDSVK